jgi:hypothetical protein
VVDAAAGGENRQAIAHADLIAHITRAFQLS